MTETCVAFGIIDSTHIWVIATRMCLALSLVQQSVDGIYGISTTHISHLHLDIVCPRESVLCNISFANQTQRTSSE